MDVLESNEFDTAVNFGFTRKLISKSLMQFRNNIISRYYCEWEKN